MTSIITNIFNQMFYVFSWFSKKSYRLVKHQVVKFQHIFPTFFIDEAASCLTWESNTEIYSKQSSTFQSQKQLNHLLPFVSQGVREDDAIFSKTAYPLTFFNLFFATLGISGLVDFLIHYLWLYNIEGRLSVKYLYSLLLVIWVIKCETILLTRST